MWIFGYGSLVWKVGFPYEERVVGYIKGYKRRFWQASVDHRGTPEKPGRVVTLVKSDDPEAKVWGVAYHTSENTTESGGKLDHREKRFNERQFLPFYKKDGAPLESHVLVFIGSKDSTLTLGPAPFEKMSFQIASSVGPSGSNIEYFLNLLKFLNSEAPESTCEDEDIFNIAKNLENMGHLRS